eukprot:CAMPEP_0116070762 /NCGR_PEP_ID=MMETSP0322-20121206/13277_1 /TAXON_ID=163516 /ORGANISM="Leptocylindrus danicus var. apora, Strain B651" /LENGTH=73 /DNA_ID=CAMNT_0003558781 /DNA_START=35 /DNA_END=256 /DNA_ORIENTATION=+
MASSSLRPLTYPNLRNCLIVTSLVGSKNSAGSEVGQLAVETKNLLESIPSFELLYNFSLEETIVAEGVEKSVT